MTRTFREQERRVLVTGASGFLGRRLLPMLVKNGWMVRALVRTMSKLEPLRLPGVELCHGDVTDADSLYKAVSGMDCVVHAAADTSGSEQGARSVTIGGTRNVLEQCASSSVRHVVYISSCSVYGVAEIAAGHVIDEAAPLEPFPQRRGTYSWAKLEAEKLVNTAMEKGLPVVCLRPGTIYGPGGENFTPMVGFAVGRRMFVVIGDGRMVLPLVHVDNLAAAVLAALEAGPNAVGTFNVVDPERIDKRRYMDTFICKLHPGAHCLYLPYGLLYGATLLQEWLCTPLRLRPVLTRYRLLASQKEVHYDASRIGRELGWRPVIGFADAVADLLGERRRG